MSEPPIHPPALEGGSPGAPAPGLDRIATLDGVRGLAVIAVMLHHFVHGMSTESAASKITYRIVDAGYAGVDLFFVLSGFLITGILVRTAPRPGYFVNFYARRTVRIFPLYYATLVIVFLIVPSVSRASAAASAELASHQGWYWAYLANWAFALIPDVPWDYTHVWSLAIEEQFYLVWPLVVWACSRRALIRICVAGIIGALALRACCVWLPNGNTAAYMLTPMRADSLLMGALVSLLSRGGPGASEIRGPAVKAALVSGAIVLALAGAFRGLPRYEPLVYTIGYSAIDALCAASLLLVLCQSPGAPVAKLLASAPLRLFGTLSYCLYIVHPFVDSQLRLRLPGLTDAGSLPRHLLHAVLGTAISVVVALASWHLFEKHWLELKKRFG